MATYARIQIENIQAVALSATAWRNAYLETGNVHLYKQWMTQLSLLWYMRAQLDK